ARVRFSPDGRALAALCHDVEPNVAVWAVSAEASTPGQTARWRSEPGHLREAEDCLGSGDQAGSRWHLAQLTDANLASPWEWLSRGLLRQRCGDQEGADADFRRAVADMPDASLAWLEQGRASLQRGRWQRAAEEYGRAFKTKAELPADAWLEFARARLL